MDSFKKKSERKKKQIGSSQKSQAKSLAFFFDLAPPLFPLLPLLSRPQKRTKHVVAVGTRLRGAKVVRERGPDVSVRACFVPMPLRHRLQTGAVALFLLRPRPRSLSPSLFLPPPPPPHRLSAKLKKKTAPAPRPPSGPPSPQERPWASQITTRPPSRQPSAPPAAPPWSLCLRSASSSWRSSGRSTHARCGSGTAGNRRRWSPTTSCPRGRVREGKRSFL